MLVAISMAAGAKCKQLQLQTQLLPWDKNSLVTHRWLAVIVLNGILFHAASLKYPDCMIWPTDWQHANHTDGSNCVTTATTDRPTTLAMYMNIVYIQTHFSVLQTAVQPTHLICVWLWLWLAILPFISLTFALQQVLATSVRSSSVGNENFLLYTTTLWLFYFCLKILHSLKCMS